MVIVSSWLGLIGLPSLPGTGPPEPQLNDATVDEGGLLQAETARKTAVKTVTMPNTLICPVAIFAPGCRD